MWMLRKIQLRPLVEHHRLGRVGKDHWRPPGLTSPLKQGAHYSRLCPDGFWVSPGKCPKPPRPSCHLGLVQPALPLFPEVCDLHWVLHVWLWSSQPCTGGGKACSLQSWHHSASHWGFLAACSEAAQLGTIYPL